MYSLGCSFYKLTERWKRIEIGQEIKNMIEEMKCHDFKKRPSIDNLMERLNKYCDQNKYSDSIDIITHLKENQTFVQDFYNDDILTLKNSLKK